MAPASGGVVIAIGAIAGWQWYQKDQGGKLASANVEYQKALAGLQQNKLDDAAKAVKALEAGPSSIYGDLAALQLAKAQVDAGQERRSPGDPARGEGRRRPAARGRPARGAAGGHRQEH
jgi:predicted negative regulator of RcsB-dependent stress response